MLFPLPGLRLCKKYSLAYLDHIQSWLDCSLMKIGESEE
jgi:hypothetical protein